MAQGSRGVSRVLAKLKNSIEEGKYYEAHQMYRTLYFRLVAYLIFIILYSVCQKKYFSLSRCTGKLEIPARMQNFCQAKNRQCEILRLKFASSRK